MFEDPSGEAKLEAFAAVTNALELPLKVEVKSHLGLIPPAPVEFEIKKCFPRRSGCLIPGTDAKMEEGLADLEALDQAAMAVSGRVLNVGLPMRQEISNISATAPTFV